MGESVRRGKWEIPRRVRCLEYFEEILNVCEGRSVLNIGATGDGGTGWDESIHDTLKQSASAVHGIDLNPIPEEGIFYMDIQEDHPVGEKFDVIMFFGVMDHLDNQGNALDNIAQCSHEGTIMYLAVQNIGQFFNVIRLLLARKYKDDTQRSLRTEAQMRDILERHGWEVWNFRYGMHHGPDGQKLWRRIFDFFLPERLGVTMMVDCVYTGKTKLGRGHIKCQ